jgi:hypothetical protein
VEAGREEAVLERHSLVLAGTRKSFVTEEHGDLPPPRPALPAFSRRLSVGRLQYRLTARTAMTYSVPFRRDLTKFRNNQQLLIPTAHRFSHAA